VREKLIKRLNEIIAEILKADDAELDKIGIELLDIEKKLMGYKTPELKEKKF
jgi:hypothetical protein